MLISEAIYTLKAQKILKKTPCGRPITQYALDAIEAALNDEKNWGSEVLRCPNCCIIQSSLLVPEGCANCGSKDLLRDITKADIL